MYWAAAESFLYETINRWLYCIEHKGWLYWAAAESFLYETIMHTYMNLHTHEFIYSMNSHDSFIYQFICFMNSYMNSGEPRFRMPGRERQECRRPHQWLRSRCPWGGECHSPPLDCIVPKDEVVAAQDLLYNPVLLAGRPWCHCTVSGGRNDWKQKQCKLAGRRIIGEPKRFSPRIDQIFPTETSKQYLKG